MSRRRLAPKFRFTFAHGVVSGDRKALVEHMANCLDMPGKEWAALDGKEATPIGLCTFQVGRAVVTIQHGLSAPYGSPTKSEPLGRSA